MDSPQLDSNAEQGLEHGLSVISISKAFDDVIALSEVSLDVAPGEVVGLFGRDGAGKTVCFQSIVGLTYVDSGRILLNHVDLTQLTINERADYGLSYLPQEPSIFRGMTTAENIMAALEQFDPDEDRRLARLDALLAEYKIDYVRDVLAVRLSGGERRRCEIARAMATSPTIMLFDEPFAGIDPLSIVVMKRTISELREKNIGILISDQNVHEMLEVIDRAYILHEGRIVFAGSPAAMLADQNVRKLYLGEDFLP